MISIRSKKETRSTMLHCAIEQSWIRGQDELASSHILNAEGSLLLSKADEEQMHYL